MLCDDARTGPAADMKATYHYPCMLGADRVISCRGGGSYITANGLHDPPSDLAARQLRLSSPMDILKSLPCSSFMR